MNLKTNHGMVIFTILNLMLLLNFWGYADAVPKETFPEKTVVLIVPYGPGGGFDIDARVISGFMKDKLGIPMIVKNVPGGGGRTGLNTLYRSKPDGYTIGMLNIPGFAISQLIKKTLYDLEKMEYIGKISEDRYCVPVKADSPFNSIDDLKNVGRPIKVGAIGTTSTGPILCMISFSKMGIPFEFVTGYKSSAECILAVMRGDVDTTMSGPIGTNVPFINNGDIKALVSFTKERRSELPNVVTCGEIGYPELANLGIHRILAAPPKTPKERVAVLQKTISDVIASKEFQKNAEKMGREYVFATAEESREIVATNLKILLTYKDILQKYMAPR